MGTRSFVGIMVGDKCHAVYVHWDGYLNGVGAELQGYRKQDEVEELVSHGDRSSLEGEYYKDRGEDDVDPIEYENFNELFDAADGSGAEWYYIFNDGTWYCGNTYSGSNLYQKLIPYSEAVNIWETEEAATEDSY